MKVKSVYFYLTWGFVIILASSVLMPHAQTADNPWTKVKPKKDAYYICFDNSSSLKKYEFYKRLIGALISYLRREGVEKDKEIKYIPFGSGSLPKIFDKYREFASYVNTNFPTTDFGKLSDRLAELDNQETVIIISDGEHDISTQAPFSHLTITEMEQMLEVVNQLKQKNIKVYSIHILKEYSEVEPTLDLEKYYQDFLSRNRTREENPQNIAALTMDFMKNLASNEDDYHLCTDNVGALRAVLDIFGIPKPVQCDVSKFKDTIPLNVTFEFVDSGAREWLWLELRRTSLCIDGVERTIVEDQTDGFFKMNVTYVTDDAYTIKFGTRTDKKSDPILEIIWNERDITGPPNMDEFINTLSQEIKAKIQGEFAGNPRFSAPRCLISIKFLDQKLYTFLKEENFLIHVNSCDNKQAWRKADVTFFDEDYRVYVSVPMTISDKLQIMAPEFPVSDEIMGKDIELKANIGNIDAEEITIKQNDIPYPTFSYDFSHLLQEKKGTVLLFSAETKRFYGMAGEIAKQNHLDLMQGQKYTAYFVPDDLENNNIKFFSRPLESKEDVGKVLELVKPSGKTDAVFLDWVECLAAYNEAWKADESEEQKSRQNNTAATPSSKSKDKTGVKDEDTQKPIFKKHRGRAAREIATSNGYFRLLHHLAEILEDDDDKKTFLDLLDITIQEYKGFASPFQVIDLLRTEIPGFSEKLKDEYLGIGREEKIQIILVILSNPIKNLAELKNFITNNLRDVSPENQNYFIELMEE